MPKLGTIARVLWFPLAGLIVLSAVSITLLDPSAQAQASTSTQSSATAAVGGAAKAASATLSADQDTDLTVIALLRSRPSFQRQSNASLIDASKSACLLLAQGDRASYILATTTSAGISADDAVYFLAVAWKPTAPHIETLPSPPLPPPHRNRPRDTVPRVSFPRISPGELRVRHPTADDDVQPSRRSPQCAGEAIEDRFGRDEYSGELRARSR